jgi:nucleotide-binding universal stress UspA family protein
MAVRAPERTDVRDTRARSETHQTLLVGYDGSDESRAAFIAAIERASPNDTILVVHAYQPVWSWLGTPYYQRAIEDTLQAGQRILDELRAPASMTPAEVRFELHEGPPAEALTRVGGLREVDEIIVGSRGLSPLRAALGSVSREVLRTANRPVLVVPHKAIEPV